MKYRKLRMAWSAVCGILCLLLIALWVRSYWHFDMLEGELAGRKIKGYAAQGKLRVDWYSRVFSSKWEWSSQQILERQTIGLNPGYSDGGAAYMNAHFNLSTSARRSFVWTRFWIPVLLVGTLAGISWLPWRFSLRTLLIGMTLIAIGLRLSIALLR